MRDLAQAQIQISKEKGAEFFETYRKKMFPWVEKSQERDADHHKKLLEHLVKKGPIRVTALKMPEAKSRLVQRKERAPMSAEQKQKNNELYKKLGKSIPV